jgi:hypothetical protein
VVLLSRRGPGLAHEFDSIEAFCAGGVPIDDLAFVVCRDEFTFQSVR